MKQLLLLISALLVSLAATALDLDTAREQGLIGEKQNGYLGLVSSKNAEAAVLMMDINQQRRSHYQEIANKQNTPLPNIEKIAGEKLTDKARSEGYFYEAADGSWTKN